MLKLDLPVGLIWDLAERYSPTPQDGEVRHQLATERFDTVVRYITEVREDHQEAVLRALVAQSPRSGGSADTLENLLSSATNIPRRGRYDDFYHSSRDRRLWEY